MTDVRMPRGWRTVEMPPAVAALPLERRGFPIPYVAERAGKFAVTKVRIGGYDYAAMACLCRAGHGEPDLGNQCVVRQRECMEFRACSVCAQDIPAGPLAFIGGEALDSFVEPPLHLACAAYSIQVCPGITRRPMLAVHVADEYALTGLWDQFDPETADKVTTWRAPIGTVPLAVKIGLPAVLGFYAATPVERRTLTPDEFLAEQA